MQTKHFPVATVSIIILNAVIFALGLLSGEQTQIIQNYGFIPNHIFNAYDDGNNNNAQQHPLTSLLQSSEPQPSLSLSSLPSDQRISKIRAVKKIVEIFSAAIREKKLVWLLWCAWDFR
jgi:hypothetical protein